MHITFQNRLLRTLCEDNHEAERMLGKVIASKLKTRLADISAISLLSDLLVGNPRKIEIKSLNYVIDLAENFVVVFAISHVSVPLNDIGEVDNSKVRRIKILDITTKDDSIKYI